jgi:ABC-type uncharacterized transport system permease subunit
VVEQIQTGEEQVAVEVQEQLELLDKVLQMDLVELVYQSLLLLDYHHNLFMDQLQEFMQEEVEQVELNFHPLVKQLEDQVEVVQEQEILLMQLQEQLIQVAVVVEEQVEILLVVLKALVLVEDQESLLLNNVEHLQHLK